VKRRKDKRRSFYVSFAYQNGEGAGFGAMDVSFTGPLKVSTIPEIQRVIADKRGLKPLEVIPLTFWEMEE
jgi:hypothetical protein